MPTYEQMAALLRSNGWETLWSENFWVRTKLLANPRINIDWAGCDTESAFKILLKELDNK